MAKLKRKLPNYQNMDLADQRKPDFIGIMGRRMWRAKVLINPAENPEWGATLGIWILNVPYVHPTWKYYVMLLMHLRPIPGKPAPFKVHPNAGYDLAVMTLDPENPLPDLAMVERAEGSEGKQICTLDPADFASQFGTTSDTRATLIAERLITKILLGDLLDGDDYRQRWASALHEAVQEFS
jgi:hypothetical protein